jgi:hypothetical protein
MRPRPWLFSLCLLAIVPVCFSGQRKQALVCRADALSAMKPAPKLGYQCGEQANDYDESILKLPARIAAIGAYETRLARFTSAAWWRTSVDDLNICDFRGKPGALTKEENENFQRGDYQIRFFGNHQIRLVLAADPCYQTGFNGSDAFLLYRKAGRASVTEVLDGYFSRADNSVGLDFATSNAGVIIEISTGTGGLHPEATNYYFVIDQKTNRAVPKNLFRGDMGLTNSITSMLLSEPKDLSLPRDADQLNIIRGRQLARTFSIYSEDEGGRIDDNGRKLTRAILRWNGKFYQ